MPDPNHPILQSTIEKFQTLPLSRREFLQRCLQLGALAPIGSIMHELWKQETALNNFNNLQFFTDQQAKLLSMMAEILVNPDQGWPTVGEAQVVEYIDAAMAAADGKTRTDIRKLLELFENRFVALLFDLRFETFSAMPRQEQHDYMRDWMTSNLAARRSGFMALKRLATSAYYTHRDTWPKINYAGPLLEAPEPRIAEKQLRLAERPSRNLSYDAIVIGSGAGGSVVAARLAQAGMRVAIVEKGGYYDRHDFNQSEREMVPALFMKRGLMATDDLSIILLAGECVGGGTTINWCTSMEVPPHVLADWRERTGFADLTPEHLQPFYENVRQRLNITAVPESDHNANNRIIFEGAAQSGLSVKTIHRNAVSDAELAAQHGIPVCIQCGFCGVGCAYDAKRSTLVTYLVDAVAGGADLFAHANAEKIVVDANGAKRVLVLHEQAGGEPKRFELSAPVVVVAGGALQSPALLLRSGLANGSGQVGKNLYLHPTTALFGQYDRSIEMGYGIPQSALYDQQIDQGDGYGFWLETAPAQPGLAAIAVPEFGAAHRELMRKYPQMSNVIILVRDRGHGRVELDEHGEAMVKYELHERDERSLLDGMKLSARLMRAAGAQRIFSLHAEAVATDLTVKTSQDNLEYFDREIESRGIEPNRCVLFSAHQMGTCRMGADPRASVVNRYGECHNVKDLYVADGSIFPASAGINPMLPIMALAEEIAENLVHR